MRRILVIGSCGAGKSVFSRRLADLIDIDLIHLDAVYWKAGWIEPDKEQWRQTVVDLMAGESWIIDGNYGGTMDLRLQRCDTAIFLDFSRYVCTWRVLKRWFIYRNQNRPDMAKGCRERFDWAFLKWTWSYPERSRPHVLERLNAVRGEKHIITLRNSSEVESFLNGIETRELFN